MCPTYPEWSILLLQIVIAANYKDKITLLIFDVNSV